MKRIAALAVFTIAACACTRTEPPVAVTSIAMEQYECFWRTCPHYRIVLRPDGSAAYTGFAVVRRIGNITLHPGPKAFQSVSAELQRLKFFSLRPRYAAPADGCTHVLTDQSSVTFSATRPGETKTVFLYYGCEGLPEAEALARLAATIDREAGVAPLLGRGSPVE